MLAHHGIAFAARDLFKNPLTPDEIRSLALRASVEQIFSWRSPTARARGLQPGALDDDALIALMAEDARLIRRPLILSGDALVIGADAAAISDLAAS